MLPMPLGHEIDVQRSDDEWAVFWQEPDGTSRLVLRVDVAGDDPPLRSPMPTLAPFVPIQQAA